MGQLDVSFLSILPTLSELEKKSSPSFCSQTNQPLPPITSLPPSPTPNPPVGSVGGTWNTRDGVAEDFSVSTVSSRYRGLTHHTHTNKNKDKKNPDDSFSAEYHHHHHHLNQPMTRHPCVPCDSSVANRLAALWKRSRAL